jgi:hypothetical protein
VQYAISDNDIFRPVGIALAFLIAATPAGYFGLPFGSIQTVAIEFIGPDKIPASLGRLCIEWGRGASGQAYKRANQKHPGVHKISPAAQKERARVK